MAISASEAGYYPRCRVVLTVALETFDGTLSQDTHVFNAVPRSVEIDNNSFRAADAGTIELDFWDFPMDPRTIRGATVAVYLADTGAPDTELAIDDNDNLKFFGVVDTVDGRLDESAEVVTLKSRDFTAYFLDHKWPTTAVDLTGTLDSIITRIYAEVGTVTRTSLPVAYGPGAEGASTANVAAKTGKTKHTPGEGDDAWTVLLDVCGKLGLVPVVDRGTLVIKAPNADTGVTATQMVYGWNLSRLTYSRKLGVGDTRTQQIRVTCWDPQKRESRTADYPATPIVVRQKVGADGKITPEYGDVVPWNITGSFSVDECRAIAQGVYEDIAREQIAGSFSTREMRSEQAILPHANAATIAASKLWQLANGSKVSLTLGRPDDLAVIRGMSSSEAVAYLVNRADFDPAVASAIVDAMDKAEDLATTFYVKAARHKWSRDDGYSLDVDFINYV